MTGVLIGLQGLCVTTLAVAFAMVRFSRRQPWLWLMGLAALGLVVCASLAAWGSGLGLGYLD